MWFLLKPNLEKAFFPVRDRKIGKKRGHLLVINFCFEIQIFNRNRREAINLTQMYIDLEARFLLRQKHQTFGTKDILRYEFRIDSSEMWCFELDKDFKG